MKSANRELKIAIEASIKAGIEIIKIYNSDFNVKFKDDRSPLTLADKNANEVINSYLNRTNIPIISEENKQIDFDVRKHWNLCWIVDPLDGTKEFVKRNDEFTVNIALIENGIPILGVIYVPVKRTLYYADVKSKELHKAYVSDENHSVDDIISTAEAIVPKKVDQDVARVVGSRSHMNQETQEFIQSLESKKKEVTIISRGSSLKFCLVAEGQADIYPRFAPTMEWDTAAAHAICTAAGVLVISHDTKRELRYNKENLLNPWFVCKRNAFKT